MLCGKCSVDALLSYEVPCIVQINEELKCCMLLNSCLRTWSFIQKYFVLF